jgi:hypothetical protein
MTKSWEDDPAAGAGFHSPDRPPVDKGAMAYRIIFLIAFILLAVALLMIFA